MVVQVHVHKDAGGTKVTVVEPQAAPEPEVLPQPPAFTGVLFGWEDHYRPIVKRFAAKAERQGRRQRARAFFKRSHLLIMLALLGTMAVLSCRYL